MLGFRVYLAGTWPDLVLRCLVLGFRVYLAGTWPDLVVTQVCHDTVITAG